MSSTITPHGDLRKLVINHPAAQAEIFLQGAHLTAWTPAGHKPVIFLSPHSAFTPGKAIRGGVPVCLPWFGPHTDAALPMHGFARIVEWTVADVTESPEGVNVHFTLNSKQAPTGLPKYDFIADLHFTVGRELTMKLSIRNTGAAAMTFEEALHTYFVVSDVTKISVAGLQGVEYHSRSENVRKQDPDAAIRFTGETDRGYFNTESACTIDDPGLSRKIVIEKSGSRSTVVWNPAAQRATQLPDLADAWPGFVCVETANFGENKITIPPGAIHEMTATISVAQR